MRIDIPMNGQKINDDDIKAIYLFREAIRLSSERMVDENLRFNGLQRLVGHEKRVDDLRSRAEPPHTTPEDKL